MSQNTGTKVPGNGNSFNPSVNLIPFQYEQHQIRVIQDDQGMPWFIVKDVCEILGHSQPVRLVESLDDDEKGVEKVSTPGGPQEMLVMNEPGFYRCTMRSNLPAAKPFQKWVTSEVLPSIRKTGTYTMPNHPRTQEDQSRPSHERIALNTIQMAMDNPAFKFMVVSAGKRTMKAIFSHDPLCSVQVDDKKTLQKSKRLPGRHGFKVDELSKEAKDAILKMLDDKIPYQKIAEAIQKEFKETISDAAICRYNRMLHETKESKNAVA